MFIDKRVRGAMLGTAMTFILAALMLAGCSQSSSPIVATGPTALGSLATARSALSTMAPDAKLLIVQTAEAAEPTGTPIWAYLFGSPSSDKTFVVYVAAGQSMGAQEYGTGGLSAAEWAKVPGTESWKIDSDAAYASALKVSGAKGAPVAYMMGMLTYKPQADTSTVQPFVWSVQFDPGTSGATTKTIDVNAGTGAATIAK